MQSLRLILFFASLAAALSISVLSVATFFSASFKFWPPPSGHSWQHHTFVTLFRLYFIGLLSLSVLEFDPALWRSATGIPIAIVSFGCAVYWTNFLGWRNAYGEAKGLKTNGIYRRSRNPIYLVSIIGMLGWALAVGSWPVTALLVIWGLLYLGAPLLEEPWLAERYGTDFQQYTKRTPRYF